MQSIIDAFKIEIVLGVGNSAAALVKITHKKMDALQQIYVYIIFIIKVFYNFHVHQNFIFWQKKQTV